MRRLLAPLAVLLLGGAALAQDGEVEDAPPIRWPTIVSSARNVAGFVPAGWAVEASEVGDVSGDGVPDVVAILHDRARRNVLHRAEMDKDGRDTNPRLLVVALGQRGGPFRLLLANRKLIPRWTEWNLDDPLGELSGFGIARGAFSVPLHLFANAGGWGAFERSLTFRVIGGRCVLIGFDEDYTHRNTGQTTATSINYLTRVKEITRDSIGGDAPRTVRRTAIARRPLLTLDQVDDGMEFQPN